MRCSRTRSAGRGARRGRSRSGASGPLQPEVPVEVIGLPVARVSDQSESRGLQHALTRGVVNMDSGRDRLEPGWAAGRAGRLNVSGGSSRECAFLPLFWRWVSEEQGGRCGRHPCPVISERGLSGAQERDSSSAPSMPSVRDPNGAPSPSRSEAGVRPSSPAASAGSARWCLGARPRRVSRLPPDSHAGTGSNRHSDVSTFW